jgi:hypothetical protein
MSAEVTGLLDLSGWPEGMRVIVRREHPHPGAQLSLFEAAAGYRYQAFATNTRIGQLAFLEAWQRAHARLEDRIKAGKRPRAGPAPLPGVRKSTRHGCRSPRSRPTSSPGSRCSPSTATSPRESRNSCASGCCTCPPGSPAAAGDASASLPTGRGRPTSTIHSAGS